MHSDGVDRIVNPEGNEEAGQEQVGRGPNGGDNAGRPGSKEVAAGAEGDHPCYGAVDGPDQGVGAGEDLVDEETDYSRRAARHLRRRTVNNDRTRSRHLGVHNSSGNCFPVTSIADGALGAPVEGEEPKVEDEESEANKGD